MHNVHNLIYCSQWWCRGRQLPVGGERGRCDSAGVQQSRGTPSARERRDRIERDNQILLRKILDCHHGVDRDRTSNIPTPDGHRRKTEESRRTPRRLATSNQINTKRIKQRTDYENLLLLQKIQNVKPSSSVRKAFC